jgi:hypothetical protein
VRAIPTSWANTLLNGHTSQVLPVEQQTAVFSLAPASRNIGAVSLPLLAAGLAALGPAAPLALASTSYAVASLSGCYLDAVTRAWRRASRGAGR